MKLVSGRKLKFIPSSHEDAKNPGVVKKVLLTDKDINSLTKVKMINWARLLPGRSFRSHYHEDMDEIFIILTGRAKIKVDKQKSKLSEGDAVFIPANSTHEMQDIGKTGVEYIAIGLTLNKRGRTITLDHVK